MRRPALARLVAVAGCAVVFASCHAPKIAGPSLGVLGGGFATTEDAIFAEGGLELRSAGLECGLGSMAGLTLVEGGGRYLYGGLRWPRAIDAEDRWRLTPSIAAGLYDHDGEHLIDLGGSLEFRSALELSYSIGQWARVGVYVAHLSNARIYERNRGAETSGLTLSFDLGGWLANRGSKPARE